MQLRSLWKLGDFDPAIEFGRNAIADAERRFGAGHQLTLNLRGVHAQALGGSGRHAESLALLSAVRAEQETIMGTAEPSVLLTMSEEAVQMAALGRHAEALAWLAQARARLRPDHIGGSWQTVPHELDLAEARILRVSGDMNAALAKVRSAFAGLTGEYGDEDALSFDAARELTRIMELHGEAEKAATIHRRFPQLAQARPPLP